MRLFDFERLKRFANSTESESNSIQIYLRFADLCKFLFCY